jgi:hypothetical protein
MTDVCASDSEPKKRLFTPEEDHPNLATAARSHVASAGSASQSQDEDGPEHTAASECNHQTAQTTVPPIDLARNNSQPSFGDLSAPIAPSIVEQSHLPNSVSHGQRVEHHLNRHMEAQ